MPRSLSLLAPALAVAVTTVGLVLPADPAAAAGAVVITKVFVNAPGKDTKRNLNGEYVTIKNTSSKARSLRGYTLADESHHVYTFGTVRIGAHKSITVHTGSGTDSGSTRYWGRSWHVWNNSGGDSATLRSASGATLDSCAWRTVSQRQGFVGC